MFRDENLGVAAVDVVGEKFVIHSEIFGEATKEKLQTIRQVSKMIDENFSRRGVHKLTTYAENDEQYRFNTFLGWRPTGDTEVINGREFYVFEKEV